MDKTSKYTVQWSAKTPGLLVILIDQSHSMGEKYPENGCKAEFAAAVINRLISDLIEAAANGLMPKDKARIVIIGYGGKGGDSVEVLRDDMLSGYASNPICVTKVLQKVPDGDRGLVEIEKYVPEYLKGVSRGCTAMGGAYHMAFDYVSEYITEHPNWPAPILINVNDGRPWTYEREHKEVDYAKAEAQRIMNLVTADGSPLIFNAHIGNGSLQSICPGPETKLRGRQADFLFDTSSEIPDAYRAAAHKQGIILVDHARGFVSNASPEVFISFIQFGSSGAMRDRLSA